jgi:hypothetical protein
MLIIVSRSGKESMEVIPGRPESIVGAEVSTGFFIIGWSISPKSKPWPFPGSLLAIFNQISLFFF